MKGNSRGKSKSCRASEGPSHHHCVVLVLNNRVSRKQPHGRLCTIVSMSGTPAHYSEEHLLAYPVEYIAGIDLYNAGEYHAAHDAWEERWMGPVAADEKLFLQAMIQSAVAFHHLQIGRPGAARRMYLMAKEKFARLNQQIFMSLDLADYQAQLDRALSWLLSVPDPRELEPPQIEAPVIRLVGMKD